MIWKVLLFFLNIQYYCIYSNIIFCFKKKQPNIQMFLDKFREIQPLKDQSEC